MAEQVDSSQLLRLIKNRRRSVDAYLGSARPRAERLTYASVISSALAAALTAGPALGGERLTGQFADSLQMSGAPALWRFLCLLAMVASITAAITANLSKAKNAEARIVNAEACNAELEGLQTLVEFQQIPLEDAVKLYQQYVARIPFVPETARSQQRSGGARR